MAPAFFPPHLDHRASGTSTSYSYDPVSRLSQLVQNPAGTTHDLTLGFSYNPASQIISNTRSNDTYAWTGHGSGTLSSPTNGLNQLTSHNGGSISHDAKGNITCDPTVANSYGYSSENLLTNVSGSTWSNVLSYDPGMRLYQTGSVRNGYDGDERIAEYNSSGTQTARYIHGPGIDEPLIGYSGSGLATRSFLHADERGTIIARSDDAGNVVSVGKFDEYGKHQSLASRFAFAGMPMETLTYLHYARARMYNQRLPRFMQPDVIRYGDGPNMYIRTKGDPVNFTDPTGLCGDPTGDTCEPIDVVGERLPTIGNGALLRSGRGGTGSGGGGGGGARGRVSGGNQTPKYQISRRLTKKNTKCSLSQVSQAVNQNSVPGSPGTHVSGKTYPVSTFFGISPGDIQFRASADGRTFVNETLSNHWFRHGTVTTTITGNQREGFVANVVGTGTNTNAFTAWLNKQSGPGLFAQQLSSMHMAVLAACGG